ncbi:hypothetical protein [Terribacillus saccharophilus]|uniref:hypothetical protein n=1 Tax=Terribacillus saccharophilus TaxID=361277 RepID=UPI002989A75F|nr:hypothetical protein [Terribacillus saccharophilus]MCM3227515.1 hypothetical protein [Terribacillus saccharophilus]
MYERFKKYEVTDVQSVEEFLLRYTKYDRHEGRGEEVVRNRIKLHQEEFDKLGYTFMSKHESTTGRIVSFYRDTEDDDKVQQPVILCNDYVALKADQELLQECLGSKSRIKPVNILITENDHKMLLEQKVVEISNFESYKQLPAN